MMFALAGAEYAGESERPFVWGADVSGVQALVWLPVQHWFLGCGSAAGPEPMSSFDCWCLAPESTLRHLWTSQNLRRRSVVGSGCMFTGVCRRSLSSIWCREGCAVRGARAAAMLAHTVSLGARVLRALLEREIWLFSIVDMTSVNGAAFRQVRVACETHTGVLPC
eukprot:scaffold3222_cov116-Isochrysis_galbana.AAC.2